MKSRLAFTLIELLVVLSIITIVASLLLPAVQMVRERARNTECENKLRQLGLALASFEAAHRQYPSDGWGWAWVGDTSIRTGMDAPGGWMHQILPYIEQDALYAETMSDSGRVKALATPIRLIACPSRRDAIAYPYTLTQIPLFNCATPTLGSRSDYAICGGDKIFAAMPGPMSVADLKSFPRPTMDQFSGIAFVRSAVRVRDLNDGTSNTLAVAEKLVPVSMYQNGKSLGDDQTALVGDDADIRRWTQFPPLRDGRIDDIERFGSAHRSGINGVMCDGSVQHFAYEIDVMIWQQAGNRDDSGAARQ